VKEGQDVWNYKQTDKSERMNLFNDSFNFQSFAWVCKIVWGYEKMRNVAILRCFLDNKVQVNRMLINCDGEGKKLKVGCEIDQN
jgi:hypothetical protein